MKKILASLTVILSVVLSAYSQSFEGMIHFSKQTAMDTVNYIYYVKGDNVRLDEIGNKSKRAEGTFLIDLKTKSLVSLSHDRKLYMNYSTGTPAAIKGKVEVKKTKKVKTILGMKCTEFIVSNPEEKTEVIYWMASGYYDFFFKLLKIINRKDKSVVYAQQIKDADGMFPFLSTQVNLETNKVEVKMEVTKIEKKNIDASLFEIPKGYQKFQK